MVGEPESVIRCDSPDLAFLGQNRQRINHLLLSFRCSRLVQFARHQQAGAPFCNGQNMLRMTAANYCVNFKVSKTRPFVDNARSF